MQHRTKFRSVALAICCVAGLVSTAPAFAQPGGAVVVRGGYYGGYGGYRGNYGYRGWYGGYYYPWAWGGVGPGLYFATLPYYYSTYGGIPYYAGNTYYLSGPAPGAPNARPPVWSEVVVYPKNGQSQYQQTTDRYECYRWAVSQLGYDPTSAGGGTVRRDLTDYNRAQTACLTARGYSVR
jgi:hypothetical protein